MDVQQGVVERFSDQAPALLDQLTRAIAAAREAGLLVVYVRLAFRDGFPEVSPRNRTFAALAEGGGFGESEPAARIHPRVAPRPRDVVVVKKRVSAFAGSDLEVVLRANQIDTLVLTGLATGGVVLSTLREAADRDYGLIVLSDACADGDPDVQRMLVERVFPRQAEVLTVAEWTVRTRRLGA